MPRQEPLKTHAYVRFEETTDSCFEDYALGDGSSARHEKFRHRPVLLYSGQSSWSNHLIKYLLVPCGKQLVFMISV